MNQRSFSIIQLSDLHLNPEDSDELARFKRVIDRVRELEPDLIVASGDVSAEGHLFDGLFAKVKDQLDQLPAPVYVIPGNHDVGNKATVPEDPVKAEYIPAWNKVFGSDRFRVDRDGWMILGLDSQIVGSGFDVEQQQLDWLDDCLAQAERDDKLVALYVHAPPYLMHPEERLAGRANYWVYDLKPRTTILKRMMHERVRLIANGHLHWYQTFNRDGKQWVWCPSLSFIVDDAIFPRGGCVSGFMHYQFTANSVTHELVRMDDLPVGMVWMDRPRVELPGGKTLTIAEVVLDLSHAALAQLQKPDGLARRLEQLGRTIRITVLLDESDAQMAEALAKLPVDVCILPHPEARRDLVETLGAERVVAIANGDVEPTLFDAAAFSIAVHGPDDTLPDEVGSADIVVSSMTDALDLILHPMRIKETLDATGV